MSYPASGVSMKAFLQQVRMSPNPLKDHFRKMRHKPLGSFELVHYRTQSLGLTQSPSSESLELQLPSYLAFVFGLNYTMSFPESLA